MHTIGGDQSEYAVIALALSLVVTVALILASRQRDENLGTTRVVLVRMGIWAATVSAFGLVNFSLLRLFLQTYQGRHYPYFAAIAIYLGLPLSVLGILGGFATGSRRAIVVLGSMAMSVAWFMAFLDNVNW
jgi:hypothetical protein